MNISDYLLENSSSLEKNLVLGPRESKSFKSISEESAKLANYLRNKLGQNKNILLVAQNSAFFIVSYLGILKSGNICVPLNPGIEKDGFDFIKERTNSEIGFISDIVKNRLNPNIECINEYNIFEIIISESQSLALEPEFDGERIAEIIFTSGSTALPKGVMLSHNNIKANTDSIVQYLDINEKDIMMVVLPFFYCYGLSLLHSHIRAGGSLVLNNNFIFLGSTFNDLNKYECTGFAGVPSHFQIMLRKSDLFKNTKFPFLRYVTQAGGKLHNAFIREFVESFPKIMFFVMYGQTEATARLSYLPSIMLKKKLGSIGMGIPGVELKVVDDKGMSIVPGETGEILARGKNIMLGYFEDPKSTAETIRNGWLYTGDLATIDEDGYIYLTARKKEIIKVGGKRVSPKEIEEVIVMMAGVIDCSVEAIDDELLGEAIKATVVINESGKKITAEDLKQFCGSKLSSYKVPSYVIFKESIAVNSTGKKVKPI
ncbi:MAG: AMP-binding protein [Flavobacterium sp.]|nr:AMP-binding protein [Flavobacterium sp.]